MEYYYDSLGRLTVAMDTITGDTWEYAYDGLGNITSAERNGETEGTWVYDSRNPDLLIAYNEADKEQADGQKNSKKGKKKATVKANIKYDKAGNPVKYLDRVLTWVHGRSLSSVSDKNIRAQYTYNKDGVRLSKNVYDKKTKTNEKTTYVLNGSTILSQKTGDETLNFYYDADGKVIGIGYNKGDGPEKEYMLSRNAFGDVESIYTAEGTCVGSYRYDPYGTIIEKSYSMSNPGVSFGLGYDYYFQNNSKSIYSW